MNKIRDITADTKLSDPQPPLCEPGEPLDLCTLFEAEETPLLHFAYSIVGRRAIAEELVQEVFLQLHSRWESVDNPKAWLYRCIRNRAFNFQRDNRREILSNGEDDFCDRELANESQSPEALLQRIEATGYLRLLLAELEESDRQLIELKYFQDLKYAEISERTGISVGNVGYRLHHLLKHLSEKLQRFGIDSSSPKSTTTY